jgi:sulfate adenylyltransferase subunit 2
MKTSLDGLIDESVTIIREVAAEFERPVLLFSGGKDSVVMLHLAVRAFAPARIPFPVMHIDTGHNFPEVIEFRDRCVSEMGVQLIVGSVQASIDSGKVADVTGPRASRNPLQTVTLLDSIAEHRFDAVFGGARRDEERARAKERVFSHRDSFGQWAPQTQRPALWGIYTGRHRQGEHFRIFPLSNWTELDIWTFIGEYNIDLPSIYYAHTRPIFKRDNMLMAVTDFLPPDEGSVVEHMQVRFRTVGDATCTAAVSSSAATVEDIIAETAVARVTERGATRADDRMSEAGMEDRKRTGYF